jgi:hypothetical protein
VAHDCDVLEITGATQDGTDTAEVFPLAFERTETVENDTGCGFVCSVILSLTQPVTLPPEGVFSLARAGYRIRPVLAAAGEVSTTIEYRDGLRGSAQPVNNIITWRGRTIVPCASSFSIKLVPVAVFLRGDFDGGGVLDISDAVSMLEYLFNGSTSGSSCQDAYDTNDDGALNIADPVRLLDYLFAGAAEPPAPGIQCGEDQTGDALLCQQSTCP